MNLSIFAINIVQDYVMFVGFKQKAQNKKQNPYRITLLSVRAYICPSACSTTVKTSFLKIAFKFQAAIDMKCPHLQSLGAQLNAIKSIYGPFLPHFLWKLLRIQNEFYPWTYNCRLTRNVILDTQMKIMEICMHITENKTIDKLIIEVHFISK